MSGILGLFASFTRHSSCKHGKCCHSAPRARLAVEQLEDRLALSWTGVPPAVISTAGAAGVALNAAGNQNGNAAITNNEVDLYFFNATTTGVYRFSALTPASSVDTVLGVFNAAGQRLAFNDDIATGNYDSAVTISLVGGQRYYFGITNYTGTLGGSYSWYVDGPQPIVDDAFEDNDYLNQAIDLGTPAPTRTLNNLKLSDTYDYFRFRLSAVGNSSSHVGIDFSHAQGNLNLTLHNATGSLIRSSLSLDDDEQISLNGLAAGVYYVRVSGARNPNYSLSIDSGVTPGAANRVLYLNFDGANISRADFVRWAGTDWAGTVNEFDADRNGITVQPFFRNRSDREQIINRVLALVREDLAPFGITVQRTTGLAVEGVGASTIFLGVSTLSNGYYHVAADVDIGNNNRTDIAFVGDENWGPVETTALAMADVTLHEAGHTYGLYHVNSGTALESMGRRYSISNQNLWAVNTRFMNQTFAEYVDEYGPHGGGRGPQNSYQTMASLFGLASGGSSSGGPAGNPARGLADLEHGHDSGCCCPVCSAAGRTSINKYQYMVLEQPATVESPAVLALSDLPASASFERSEETVRRQLAVDRVWAESPPRPPGRGDRDEMLPAWVAGVPAREERSLLTKESESKDLFADLSWLGV